MKLPAIGLMLIIALACSGCMSFDGLRHPCSLPGGALSYAEDDCGPLRPVNEPFASIAPPAPQ
ncbi:hypothetical protein M8997_012340 [Phyllobacterium sp. 21LDTY02-6]|jgi:hypothetical protein|uniref:hypothetical protein n=1 Tax=Phyllobacterium sp. 21LDTY02-6 TaxID=2944903 RepID=UPI0020224D11|nr:hypothetical protein [Phyllobacterium sp. 21LDTY02-6]MCO4317972.1 hypothetical protein [Phyllobacterium sp. 21LDTY02-6]